MVRGIQDARQPQEFPVQIAPGPLPGIEPGRKASRGIPERPQGSPRPREEVIEFGATDPQRPPVPLRQIDGRPRLGLDRKSVV